MTMRAIPACCCAVLSLGALSGSSAGTPAPSGVLAPADSRTNHFSGTEVTLRQVIRDPEPHFGRLVWSLSAHGRSLRHGTVDVEHGGDGPTITDIRVPLPAVKDGVVLDTMFTVALVDRAGGRLATHSRPVRIFPANPFVNRRRWLEGLTISVFDPVGDTVGVFERSGVPFTPLRSATDIDGMRTGLLVVGEGTSWVDEPALPATLIAAAARGVSVLCMAPRDGSMPLPAGGAAGGSERVNSLGLRGVDMIAEIDPRLDWKDWSPDRTAVTTRMAVVAEGDAAVVRVGRAETGWAWLESRHDAGDAPAGTLVICGFGIVTHWDATPAARYLLAGILSRLDFRPPLPEKDR